MPRSVTILGAGLVGSLLAIILRRRNYPVTLFERRPDMRREAIGAGRSINLAMSTRGWNALELAGLKEAIEPIAIPMTGRFLHQADGSSAFQPYGKNGEAIYSVSRGELNKQLMTEAEKLGAQICFNQRCNKVDVVSNTLHFEDTTGQSATAPSRNAQSEIRNPKSEIIEADLLFGADGAFSALRSSYSYQDRVSSSQQYIEHGYKELNIPAGENGSWQLEKNALHIWPRKNYMLIALPNIDGSFTCTLFMPFEGAEASFAALQTREQVAAFFQQEMPDVVPMMPTLVDDFFNNPTSSLITTRIFPWHHADKSALIGDAAHAIVPFYGQGMNAGFEDCSVLASLMDAHGEDWSHILPRYEELRKPAGDAVGDLALMNFIEMRDKVARPAFLERKKIEKELGRRYPEQFTSIYEMVSFSHTPYHSVMQCIQAQDRLLERIQTEGDFDTKSNDPAYCLQLDGWMNEYHESVKTATEVNNHG